MRHALVIWVQQPVIDKLSSHIGRIINTYCQQ